MLVYNNTGMDRRSVLSHARIIFQTSKDARTIVVRPGNGGRAAVDVGNVRIAYPDDSFAKAVPTEIDTVDDTDKVLMQ